MPSAALFISFFQVVTILGSALTVLKVFTSGLYTRYRIFFAFFVFRLPFMTLVLLLTRFGGTGTKTYFYVFLCSEPILILAYILVVVELYRLVLERYRGLYTLGRWAMYAAVVISASISILSLVPKIGPTLSQPSQKLMYAVYTERGVDLALVIFILLIVWFLSRYPVPLSRNVVVHTSIYAVFFLSESAVLLWRTLIGWQVTPGFNILQTAVSAACTIAWWLLLSARGEEVQVHAPALRPDAEERILEQLELLNSTLLKVSKK